MQPLLPQLRRILLLPSIVQWRNWSLPSRIGFVGFWVGLISLFIGVIPFFASNSPTREKLEKTYSDYQKVNDWHSLHKEVKKIEGNKALDDLYYFYSGIIAMETYGNMIPPHEYFERIPFESDYYSLGQSYIYRESSYNKWLNNTQASERIINNLSKHGINIPLYYFALLKTQSNISQDWVVGIYKEMEAKLSGYMNFTTFEPNISVSLSNTITYNIRYHQEARTVAFLYLTELARAANKSGDRVVCNEASLKIAKLISNKGIQTIRMGLSSMFHSVSEEGMVSIIQAANCAP